MAEKDSHEVVLATRIDAGNILLNDLMQERSKKGREVGNHGKRQQRKINLLQAFYVIILDGSERSLKDNSVHLPQTESRTDDFQMRNSGTETFLILFYQFPIFARQFLNELSCSNQVDHFMGLGPNLQTSG